ncbi:hypothetical protein COCCADRAFT_97812 [Bipolaris zeicola 26-R-13]|uniref:Uncharacterized protein n=1 Tax=Cochliobolus carbonum (strain 26-R-13) TaxID=930089 RepID=W6Y586_COCC2|nr:uncharacterized protein COCCADRAFT_97812 [Bipolaris zeicola 26-R-13]EUC32810.1 hypothetical protein COCCADRAFT_97812 [Bipolaris zeicola 26-R-13]
MPVWVATEAVTAIPRADAYSVAASVICALEYPLIASFSHSALKTLTATNSRLSLTTTLTSRSRPASFAIRSCTTAH